MTAHIEVIGIPYLHVPPGGKLLYLYCLRSSGVRGVAYEYDVGVAVSSAIGLECSYVAPLLLAWHATLQQ